MHILEAAASSETCFMGQGEELQLGLVRGALNFLFASREAKPLKVKENE